MKEFLIISGKGGTGKTSITAALAALAKNKMLVDLDVDAPDMHILLDPKPFREEAFYSGHEAEVRQEDCVACGVCTEYCSFDAITQEGDKPAYVDPIACEGCKLCVAMCPEEAIDFPEAHCGTWYASETRFGPMVHAQLFPGAENSGRLVSLLRQEARELAEERGHDLILCDGTPGIGCPVIASLSGVNFAVIVTEPTPSGRHDLLRVLDLCGHFKIPAAVLVNKADLNPDITKEFETYCHEQDLAFLGCLDFDPQFVEALVQGRIISEYAPEGKTAVKLTEIWNRILALAEKLDQ
ncbi:ATP-binding protein [Dethiosulfatarculus sandiegensis]|uniref:(4Fe-4S)-binding protein n=1 Tax=Dethiosulfatarculus sandiegensis TaxID=1429043 RepID=A0A0D2HNP2_9BACT|nr:ATP-binding protein [Dethiosulfatarculus sandiegensis]KIX12198.1 (4Fe-4S)-binding protein [Dethiosulfatarculus sandiegensis]